MDSGTRYNIGILLSIIGFSLWLYVISSTTVSWIDTSYEFGLFQQLPVFYWISLLAFVAGMLLLLEHQSRGIFLCQILVLGMMIWGTPVFVENNARITDAWWHLGTTKTILDSGRITVNSASTHGYLQWPGSFVFSSIVLSISGLPPELYMRIFPLFSSMIFVLAYYVWIQGIVDNKIVQKLSIMALFFLNLWLQFHLSPQAFDLMLFPMVLLSLMKRTMKWNLITVVLFFSLVISHPLSPFFIILLSVTEVVLFLMRKKERKLEVVFLLILMWLGWFVFSASLSFNSNITQLIAGFSPRAQERTQGTTGALITRTSLLPSLIRLITIACTMTVALLHIFRSRKQEGTRKFLYAGWIISFFLFFSYDFIFNGFALQDRAFMFAFLLVPILLVEFAWSLTNTRLKMRIMAVILLLLILPNMLTLYYSEQHNIVSDSNIQMVLNLNKYFSQGTIYGGGHCDVIFAFNTSYDYTTLLYSRPLPVDSFIVFDEFTMQTPLAPASANMRYFYGICSERIGADLLYSDGKFQIYYTGPLP